jgi:hypothetical protein
VVLWGKFILSSCFVTHISKQGFLLDFTLYFIVLNFHEPFVGICNCWSEGSYGFILDVTNHLIKLLLKLWCCCIYYGTCCPMLSLNGVGTRELDDGLRKFPKTQLIFDLL